MTTKVETINKTFNGRATQVHVLFESNYYIVSDNGEETLVFRSDKYGSITDWVEVGGGREITHVDVLSDFSNYLTLVCWMSKWD